MDVLGLKDFWSANENNMEKKISPQITNYICFSDIAANHPERELQISVWDKPKFKSHSQLHGFLNFTCNLVLLPLKTPTMGSLTLKAKNTHMILP